MTQLGDNPGDTVTRILGSYRIHNAEVLIREDVSVDDIIDIIEGNRKVRIADYTLYHILYLLLIVMCVYTCIVYSLLIRI